MGAQQCASIRWTWKASCAEAALESKRRAGGCAGDGCCVLQPAAALNLEVTGHSHRRRLEPEKGPLCFAALRHCTPDALYNRTSYTHDTTDCSLLVRSPNTARRLQSCLCFYSARGHFLLVLCTCSIAELSTDTSSGTKLRASKAKNAVAAAPRHV